MKRRGAIKTITAAAGASLVLPAFGGCKSDRYQPSFFSIHDLRLIDEIAETILPATVDAPGAKDCRAANFVDRYIDECYTLDNQRVIKAGIEQFKIECQASYHNSFDDLSAQDKEQFLTVLDDTANVSASTHFFGILKSTIVFAYFTSKDGVEQALDYLPIPGKYIGSYPLTATQKTWAL